jgi:multidrug efflux pump subunit AcrA (membrane-fusion protein)
VLPGTLQGYVESPIYARSSGYLLRWHKDIGSRVAKGELRVDIDTPEVDQQLSQTVAGRQQAAAGLELAKSSFERWKELRQEDTVSQQELDERRSAYAQAQANLAAAEANVLVSRLSPAAPLRVTAYAFAETAQTGSSETTVTERCTGQHLRPENSSSRYNGIVISVGHPQDLVIADTVTVCDTGAASELTVAQRAGKSRFLECPTNSLETAANRA